MGRYRLAQVVGDHIVAQGGILLMKRSGVEPGPYSVEALLDILYKKNPEAVINGEGGPARAELIPVRSIWRHSLGLYNCRIRTWGTP